MENNETDGTEVNPIAKFLLELADNLAALTVVAIRLLGLVGVLAGFQVVRLLLEHATRILG